MMKSGNQGDLSEQKDVRKNESSIFYLLNHFQYCFKTEDNTGWIFPDLMDETTEPTLKLEKTAYPTRVFQYEQPIQNIHYQIFAQYFTSLKPDSLSQNGAVITKGKAQVAVIFDKTARTIRLLIDGPGSGALREEIEAKIEETNSVEQLAAVKNVPCSCSQCLSDKKPTLYPYSELIDFQSKGETNVQCTKSRALVPIQDLLALEPAKIRAQTLIETYIKISNADEKRMQELLQGKDDSARLEWLEKGLQVYKTVCKVVIGTSGMGTGFLLDDGNVLTCNHNIETVEDVTRSYLEFSELENPDQKYLYKLDPERFEFSSSKALNFSKIGVFDQSEIQLLNFGAISTKVIPPVKLNDPVFVIRIHEGHLKQIDLKPSIILETGSDFLFYTFHERSLGSSGGPIFNANWDCIGMHQAAGGKDSGGMEIGNTGRKEPARKGTLLKAILKPANDVQQPDTEQSPIMAEIEFIQDLVAQSDLDGALKALTALDEKFQIGIKNDIIMLSANMKRTQKEYDGELLTHDDYRSIQALNTHRLLDLLNEIPLMVEEKQEAPKQPSDIRRKIKK